MQPIAPPGSPAKKQESSDAQKVLRLLARELRAFGFERTKPTFFTRPGQFVVEFIHVHKYTFGPSFRLHLGIRVRTDEFPAAALNGPSSDALVDPNTPDRSYSFNFAPTIEGIVACSKAMAMFVATVGAAWFDEMRQPETLLSPSHSPLRAPSIATLQQLIASPAEVVTSAETLRALGVD